MKKSVILLILSLVLSLCCFVACQRGDDTNDIAVSPEVVPVAESPEITKDPESSVGSADDPVSAVPEPVDEESAEEEPESVPGESAEATTVDWDYYFMGSRYGLGDFPSKEEFYATENALERVKQYYEELYDIVNRIEFHNQALEYVGTFTADPKFSANGETNEKGSDGNLHTQLQTFMIGRYMYGFLDDCISLGKNFDNDCFVVTSVDNAIPVVLGHAYSDVFCLGDEFTLSLHLQPLNFVVIGFLSPDTYFNFGENYVSLDQRIIVPLYDIEYDPTDGINEFYQQLYYLQKCEGYICVDPSEDINDTYEAVLALAEKYDLHFAVTPQKVYRVLGL